MLIDGKKVPYFDLQDTLICYMGYLCVPSSEHAKLIWKAHYSRVAWHFVVEKTMVVLQKTFIGQNLDKTLENILDPTLPVPSPSQPSRSKACTLLCLLPTSPRNPYPWTICRASLLQIMVMTVYLWSWTDFLRWPYFRLARRVSL